MTGQDGSLLISASWHQHLQANLSSPLTVPVQAQERGLTYKAFLPLVFTFIPNLYFISDAKVTVIDWQR